MILVDTSVLIGYLKGSNSEKISLLEDIILKDIPFGISPYTYQEVLQGSKDQREFAKLKEYLSVQNFYALPSGIEPFEEAAKLYFDLRKKGVTIRSTIDILIALTAIKNNVFLLHDDRDFDNIAQHVKDLRILSRL